MKDNFNNERLRKLNYPLTEVPSLDKNPSGVCQSKLATVANRSQSQTGDLAKLFRFKKSSRVMIATNVNIDDHLVNRELGTTVNTKEASSGILNKIYVKFEDENAGLTKKRSDRYASENDKVPIVRIEANFSVSLNSEPTIHQTQFPLMLLFACTVHKVQGLKLPGILVSFNLNRKSLAMDNFT